MSFRICRGTLGSLAMFTGIRNASSRDSRVAAAYRWFGAALISPDKPAQVFLNGRLSENLLGEMDRSPDKDGNPR